ncbi:thermonuclease family protein [Desulfovibrio sp.]|uniref:thermonuclease family protein n=1 Tax=Desulfovibrio sp. TaxID=885 RepID=UPI0025C2829F|nr:thermonuclease family protein [Desulfovibrio sp.]
MFRTFCLCLACCLVCAASAVFAGEAWVVRVEDGNTISVSSTRNSDEADTVLRFYGIDAPSLSQPFGAEALQRLARIMPRGTKVTFEPVGRSESGTVSALVQVGGASVNYQLVVEGLAWVDRQTCKAIFCRRWMIQEHQAVVDKRGIWGLNIGTPPWQWGR